jgi:hypothetical protein
MKNLQLIVKGIINRSINLEIILPKEHLIMLFGC